MKKKKMILKHGEIINLCGQYYEYYEYIINLENSEN